jgi:DNA-binding transcriptional ArsR family regulator
VSASAGRARLGAGQDPHPSAAGRGAVEWPAALLVASAAIELGRAALGARDDAAPWELVITVPPSALDLTRRTGLAADPVRRALDALISAEALDCRSRVGDEFVVQCRAELFEDAPVVGALDWRTIRDRLATALSPAALLVVRALAARTTPDDRARERFVPASLRDLEEATGSGKAAVRTALAALTRAGLVESKLRPRVDSWHRLLGGAFGEAPAAAREVVVSPAPARASAGVDALPLARPRSRPADAPRLATPTPPAPPPVARSEPGAWAIVEVNGVALPVPPGVVPQPEQDAATGDWYLRVGPNVRYGPLRFFS